MLSNLDVPTDDDWTIVSGEILAQSFQVGNGAVSYSFDELQVRLSSAGNNSAPLIFSVYTDNSDKPGTQVGGLTALSLPSAAGVYSFAPDTPFTLDAGTTYWIVGSTSGASQYPWRLASGPGYTSQDDWSIDESTHTMAYSENGGADWAVYGGETDALGPLLFSISATAVPEPAAPFLLGTGMIALAIRRSRGRQVR